MKKIIAFTICILIGFGTMAQSLTDMVGSEHLLLELMRFTGVILLMYIPGTLILQFVKMLFEYRLKRRMIEKGVSETFISQLLQPDYKATRFTALKWVCLFCGAGLGLLLASFFPPFGIHSMVMLTFCLAAGFLGYYLLMNRINNQDHLQP